MPHGVLPVNVEIEKSFNNRRRHASAPLGLDTIFNFNLRSDLVLLFPYSNRAGQLLIRSKRDVHPLRIFRSTAANTLHLCDVVSFELHDVGQIRATRRSLDRIYRSPIYDQPSLPLKNRIFRR